MTKKHQLPKEFAEKWVAALRSGEYQQGKLALVTEDNTYCCLGVACKVVEMPESLIYEKRGTIICDYWANKHGIPESLDGDLHKECTEMNDEQGKSFAEIADWIEANVEFVTA